MIPTLNRLDHLKTCLTSLSRCTWADRTSVYIALDYPPSSKYVDGYKQVSSFLDQCDYLGFKELHIVKREVNYGPAKNFREMQKSLFLEYDRVICSDDDIEFSPNFLVYMDTVLEKYEGEKDVVAVSGYSYPVHWKTTEDATCLKQNVSASDWGIGYWRDTYNEMIDYLYNDGPRKALRRVIKEQLYKRMIDVAKKEYITHACSLRFKNKDKDYWRLGGDFAMRCYIALENKYIIAPVITKTRNHGFDGSGACCDAIVGDSGETALTYNYEMQPIDSSSSFDLVEDTLHDYEANRGLLNAFDCREPSSLARTNCLIWLCENIGCWAGQLYARALQPYDLIKLVWSRLVA